MGLPKGPRPRYRCKVDGCNMIVAIQTTHLINWHDDLVGFYEVQKAYGEDNNEFFDQFFDIMPIESELSCKDTSKQFLLYSKHNKINFKKVD